jgi:hypothetical protein
MLVITIDTDEARWYFQRVEARALFTRALHYAYRFSTADEAHEARESAPFLRALEQEFVSATVGIEEDR